MNFLKKIFTKNDYMLWCICGPNGSNFGDLIGPWLYEKIKGRKPLHIDQKAARTFPNTKKLLVTCGSLLQPKIISGGSIIWGSGIINRVCEFPEKPLKICAVRGPLSRKTLMDNGFECPEVYGDPAVLMPRFYTPNRKKHTCRIGLIPHFTCYQRVKEFFTQRKDIIVIDVDRSVEAVIDDIASCEATFSSSLHGIIISHAYGIPCQWISPFDKPLYGDGVKFHDYYMSIGRQDGEATPITFQSLDGLSIENLIKMASNSPGPIRHPNLDALLKACPY